jgi:hypothetical protein
MDGNRFDELSKMFGRTRSRRTAVKELVAGAAASGAGLVRTIGADAAAKCRRKGDICRKDGDCCSNACGAPDRFRRRRCCQGITSTCTTGADCCSGMQCCGNGT